MLVKSFSHLAIVAVGQSTDSSTGGTLGLIHKQLLALYLLFCLKPLNICLQLRQDVKAICLMLYSFGKQSFIG